MNKVSIVITAYLEKSKPYLDLCIKSIRNLDYPSDLLDIVIVAPENYQPQYDGARTLCPRPGEYHNPVAINYGVANSDQSSKHILYLNDDVILTRNSLTNLVRATGDGDAIMGAISNCDNYGHYQLQFPGRLNGRQYRLEDVAPHVNEMMNAQSLYPSGVIFPRTLYLYANLIPRKVWQKVGEFDEKYLTGFDDTDYCMRAQRAGVALGICLDALIWHGGGVSADITMGNLDSNARAENESYFRDKWSL